MLELQHLLSIQQSVFREHLGAATVAAATLSTKAVHASRNVQENKEKREEGSVSSFEGIPLSFFAGEFIHPINHLYCFCFRVTFLFLAITSSGPNKARIGCAERLW
jgi:hypothetical protein